MNKRSNDLIGGLYLTGAVILFGYATLEHRKYIDYRQNEMSALKIGDGEEKTVRESSELVSLMGSLLFGVLGSWYILNKSEKDRQGYSTGKY